MQFEKNDTLQRWHITNTSPVIDKYGTRKKIAPHKNGTTKNDFLQITQPAKKISKGYLPWAE